MDICVGLFGSEKSVLVLESQQDFNVMLGNQIYGIWNGSKSKLKFTRELYGL